MVSIIVCSVSVVFEFGRGVLSRRYDIIHSEVVHDLFVEECIKQFSDNWK